MLLLREPALEECLLLLCDGQRQQDLARHEGSTMVVLREEGSEDAGVALLLAALQEEVLAPDHLARADEEYLDTDADLRARDADRVLVASARDDILLLGDLLHRPKLIPKARRRLEVEGRGRLLHAELQFALHILRAPLEEEQDGADHRRVILLRDLAGARREAALDMVLEARAVLQVAAGAQGEEPAQEFQALVHGRDVRVGAEVARSVLRHAVRQEDARVFLLHRDLDVRVALVVLEADVVVRAMLLDEVALEDQRLDLRVRHDDFKIRDVRDHCLDLRRVVLVVLEVLAHAVLEDDRLADVDDATRRVLHDVDAGAVRQQLEFLCDNVRQSLTTFLKLHG